MTPEDNLPDRAACLKRTFCLVLVLVLTLGAVASAAEQPVPMPPATYYGEVLPGESFVPVAGMPVCAWLADRLCGQTESIEPQGPEGPVLFAINVAGEDSGGGDGCGALGRGIVFQVEGQFMAPVVIWDSGVVHHIHLQPMSPPLSPPTTPDVSIVGTPTSLILTWPQQPVDPPDAAVPFVRYHIWRATRPYCAPGQTLCGSVRIADVTSLSWTDTNTSSARVAGDVDANYSYVVQAVNAAGASGASRAVGEFDYALTPGS